MNIGNLEIVVGPMFAGKTSWIIQKLIIYADLGIKTLYINSILDNRKTEKNDEIITTHNSNFNKLSDKIKSTKTKLLKDVDVSDYNVIGIDEGQFYEDLFDTVIYWVEKLNKTIYIVSLDGDIKKHIFGDITKLIPYADTVTKKMAYCKKCITDNKLVKAPFTGINTNIEFPKNQILPGGNDKFIPLCRKCYKNNIESIIGIY